MCYNIIVPYLQYRIYNLDVFLIAIIMLPQNGEEKEEERR